MKKRSIFRVLALLLCLGMLLAGCGEPEVRVDETRLQNELLGGSWLQAEGGMSLRFDGEGAYELFDGPDSKAAGSYAFDGQTLRLTPEKGKAVGGHMDTAGNLSLDGFGSYFFLDSPLLDTSLAGDWLYNFYDLKLSFDEKGGLLYEVSDRSGEAQYSYDGRELSATGLVEETVTGRLDEQGRLVLDGLSGCFVREGQNGYQELSAEDRDRLGANTSVGKMRTSLAGSVAFYDSDRDIYVPASSDWSVQAMDGSRYDGQREISFIVACYVPYSSVPNVTAPIRMGSQYYLFDKYTGYILSASDFYNVDGGRLYHFDSRDGRVDLGYLCKYQNAGPTGDCLDILTATYTVSVPEWYDGLMLAVIPVPDSMDRYLISVEQPEQPLGQLIQNADRSIMDSALIYNIK